MTRKIISARAKNSGQVFPFTSTYARRSRNAGREIEVKAISLRRRKRTKMIVENHKGQATITTTLKATRQTRPLGKTTWLPEPPKTVPDKLKHK